MEGKLTPDEAMAIQVLSRNEHWQKFMGYLGKRYAMVVRGCLTTKEDHRHHQGRAYELSEIARIEEKAKNILNGT